MIQSDTGLIVEPNIFDLSTLVFGLVGISAEYHLAILPNSQSSNITR